ncbi:hypothetical protein J3B02_002387 [Coemansia erecta]|uniref:(d)CMP kinase n=1 Tax=Coemansia asiatica TaxID=1052880 RepID=A0A9W7XS60_9FUNG|nr:hypothetical protein LPJ64_000274 [Coemansia asiatica]KAJ2855002.1 hypothetical protein J3B02_002387 [Coemansia erecta]KAJ2886999.1 hypothetical protein FB639_001456 [Coemansia asiatica]
MLSECLQISKTRLSTSLSRCQLVSRRNFTIAIDGPAASGKSSTARAVAQELGFGYIDSGSIYRCATLLALRQNITEISKHTDDLVAMILKSTVEIKVQPSNSLNAMPSLGRLAVPEVQVLLDGEDVSGEIRKPEVNRMVAKVASESSVREAVLGIQRSMAARAKTRSSQNQSANNEGMPEGVVMDGRDIGTTIFPNAELKIYLDASAMARAIRRWDEMNNQLKDTKQQQKQQKQQQQSASDAQKAGSTTEAPTYPSVEEIARELEARDYADINREHSPLRIASDAVVIDNTNLTFEQQVYTITDLARERMGIKPKHADL